MNIYLIGYRCTGKSSVGKILAAKLRMKFTDTDAEAVKRSRKSISEIVEISGWEEFRRIEKKIINELSASDKHVVATGGGAVLDVENVKRMKKTGILVWLRAGSETIRERIIKDAGTADFRPALSMKGSIDEIDDILPARSRIYEETMDYVVDTDCLDINGVCHDIIKQIKASKEKR